MTDPRQNIHLHVGDLPDDVRFSGSVAIDTETMGLNPHRDRLCLIQLSGGDGVCHLVQIPQSDRDGRREAPNLVAMLADPALVKIFHFARFDVAALLNHFGVVTAPVWCTKIASRLVRTMTDRHGLKDLCKEIVGIDISKHQQSSDWGAASLNDDQLLYAATDVLYLHKIKAALEELLAREGRADLAQACFDFLPTRARLDLEGWPEFDIFAH